MSTHTGTPWKIERPPKIGTNVFALTNDMTAREFVETNWDANARLIAAAPDLLEVLKDLISGEYTDDVILKWAKEAIAKAEGK